MHICFVFNNHVFAWFKRPKVYMYRLVRIVDTVPVSIRYTILY